VVLEGVAGVVGVQLWDGFSTRLIGAGGFSLVGEVWLLTDVRYPCLALQEVQLCRGCRRFCWAGALSFANPCFFLGFRVGWCGGLYECGGGRCGRVFMGWDFRSLSFG
jgi:hypothetical protein